VTAAAAAAAAAGEQSRVVQAEIEQCRHRYNFVRDVLEASSDGDPGILKLSVTYAKKTSLGRLYASYPSMQHCPSSLRGRICTRHSDIDMVNCHPRLLVQIAAKNSVAAPNLALYVRDRAAQLDGIRRYYCGCGRGEAKTLVLRLLNGGGVNGWMLALCEDQPTLGKRIAQKRKGLGDHSLVKGLQQEVVGLRKVVIGQFPSAPGVLEREQTSRPEKNTWSLFSWCLTEIENDCLRAMEQYFERDRRMSVDALIFDGMLVRTKGLRDTDLRACEAHVKAKTGWDVDLVHKPFKL
jgi:hypothetical protein